MISQHLGKGLDEERRARWVALLLQSAREAGLPNDPEFRLALSVLHRVGLAARRRELTGGRQATRADADAPLGVDNGRGARPPAASPRRSRRPRRIDRSSYPTQTGR